LFLLALLPTLTQGACPMNFGLHVISNPTGTFSFVGSLPLALATLVPATNADVMGQRAFRAPDGQLVAPKWPTFPTEADAVAFAARHGFTARTPVRR
jgi:hypothetical protein